MNHWLLAHIVQLQCHLLMLLKDVALSIMQGGFGCSAQALALMRRITDGTYRFKVCTSNGQLLKICNGLQLGTRIHLQLVPPFTGCPGVSPFEDSVGNGSSGGCCETDAQCYSKSTCFLCFLFLLYHLLSC